MDLGTLIMSISQQLKELGWAFFKKNLFENLFRILEIFNAFYIAIIKKIIVQWMPERAAVMHTFIRDIGNFKACICHNNNGNRCQLPY